MSADNPRRPAAFRLDDVRVTDDPDAADRADDRPIVLREPDEAAIDAQLPQPRRPARWADLFFGAVGILVSLAIGLWVDQLVRNLFDRAEWLGWFALAAAGVALVAVLAIGIREVAGLVRLRHIERLRADAVDATARDDGKAARAVVRELISLYARRGPRRPSDVPRSNVTPPISSTGAT